MPKFGEGPKMSPEEQKNREEEARKLLEEEEYEELDEKAEKAGMENWWGEDEKIEKGNLDEAVLVFEDKITEEIEDLYEEGQKPWSPESHNFKLKGYFEAFARRMGKKLEVDEEKDFSFKLLGEGEQKIYFKGEPIIIVDTEGGYVTGVGVDREGFKNAVKKMLEEK